MSSKYRQDPLFYRSFHLTFGGLMSILPAVIWLAQGNQSGNWPRWAWILFFCMPVVGIGFLLFGIFASDQKIASVRVVAFESTILLAILSLPLYLILREVRRKKLERSSHKTHRRVLGS